MITIVVVLLIALIFLLLYLGLLVLIARHAHRFPILSALIGIGLIGYGGYFVILLAKTNRDGPLAFLEEGLGLMTAAILILLGAVFVGGAFNVFKDLTLRSSGTAQKRAAP